MFELFPDRLPHYAWTAVLSAHSRLRWVKGACIIRYNLPPALLAEWWGSFMCHCSNTGMEQTPNKSQHINLTLEKKILQPLLPGFELPTLRSQVQLLPTSYPSSPTVKDVYYMKTIGVRTPMKYLCEFQGDLQERSRCLQLVCIIKAWTETVTYSIRSSDRN